MHEESISQAEIDALVRGIVGGEESGPGPSAGQPDPTLLQAPLREFVETAGQALTDLVGVPCQASLADVRATNFLDVASLLQGQVLVGRAALTSGLSGTVYYVLPNILGLAMITQLYGGVAPSYLDESALGALAEGLTQMNQAGLARLADVISRPVLAAQVEAVSASSISEVHGVVPGALVVAVAFDLTIADTSGRMYVILPQDSASAVVQAVKLRNTAKARPVGEVLAHTPVASPPAPSAVAAAPAKAVAAGVPSVSYQTAQFPNLAPRATREEIRNIELLLDVTLQVTVELGRTRRQIRDVLALGPGSVVELDKLAGEQVDVLVNGKLIAKGEVVVIDENYGVRITDIISPADRVQSLK